MNTYTVLFLGDVMGKPGRNALRGGLPSLLHRHKPLFTIVNGENSAGGLGITPAIADEFFSWGVDAITLGNHAFNKREIESYLSSPAMILRPANMSARAPGKGSVKLLKEDVTFTIINLCGRVFMDGYNDPFEEIDALIPRGEKVHGLLDFHGEATSEKIAMGFYCDGRISAVVGTHTHVQTADECVLSGGTAYITDVGMSGPKNSVLGMDRKLILRRFTTGLPQKFQVAEEEGVICGVVLDVERMSGQATSIERIRFAP